MVRSHEKEEFQNPLVLYFFLPYEGFFFLFGRKSRYASWSIWRPSLLEEVWRYEKLVFFKQTMQCYFRDVENPKGQLFLLIKLSKSHGLVVDGHW